MLRDANGDFEMYKGETFVYTFTAKNPDGTIKNLTGANLIFTVKNWYSEPDSSAVAQLRTPASGVVVTTPTTGQYTVTMVPTYTYAIQGDGDIPLVWDVKCIEANGRQSVLEAGNLTLHPAVTRAIV